MKKKLPKNFNPVKVLYAMPIDMLERVVNEMVENERVAREKRIINRLRRRREMARERKRLQRQRECHAKNGRKNQSHSSK